MRILYISTSVIPSREANAIQVMKMCSALARSCEEVKLFGQRGDLQIPDVFEYYHLNSDFELRQIRVPKIRGVRRIIYALQVLAALRKESAPFTLFGRDFYVLGALARLNLVRSPIWLEIHQPPAGQFHFRLQRWVFQSPHFAKLIVISHALKHEYLRLYGDLVEGKILVAHDGADAHQVPDGMRQRDCSQGSPVFKVGYIGSFYPGKGMETIAELAPLLPEYEFHVVGGSPEEVEAWENRGLPENLIFHGSVSPARIYDYMADFDVLVAPFQKSVLVGSRRVDIARWMSPLKVFEYMAGGKPMICSDLPVLREVLHHEDNALLAKAGDAQSWVEQLRRLTSDTELRRKIGRKAREDFLEHYTWDKRAQVILGRSTEGDVNDLG